MKRWILLLSGCALSAVCIWWIFRKIDLGQTREALREVHWEAWAWAALIYLCGFFPRAVRWKIMLRPIGEFRLTDTFRSVVIGYAANNVLPFRLGEFVRAAAFSRVTRVSQITAIASVAAERILDGVTLAGVLAVSLFFLKLPSQDHRLDLVVLAAGVLVSAAVVGGIIALVFGQFLARQAARLSPRLGFLFERVLGALSFLRSPKSLVQSIGLSAIIWLCEGSMFVVLTAAMRVPHPIQAGFLTLAVVNLGILLPSAPGYIGVFQVAAVSAFLALGMAESRGLAFGVLVHSAQFIPVTLLGLMLAGPLWPMLFSKREAPLCADR